MNDNWSTTEIMDLKRKCLEVRRNILDLTFYGSSSHLGGSLSSVEILTCLLFRIMNINPDLPQWGNATAW